MPMNQMKTGSRNKETENWYTEIKAWVTKLRVQTDIEHNENKKIWVEENNQNKDGGFNWTRNNEESGKWGN